MPPPDPDIQRTYREAKRKLVDSAITRLQKITGEAVEALREVMSDTESPASASQGIKRVPAAGVALIVFTSALFTPMTLSFSVIYPLLCKQPNMCYIVNFMWI